MSRPLTQSEINTLKSQCAAGDLELSDREIVNRNRRYAHAMPLLLADRDRLQRELEEARAIIKLREASLVRANKISLQRADDRDMARAGLIETGRAIGCTLADDVSTAFISLGIPAEAKLVLAALRERAERAEAEVMLDASNRHLRDYAIKQRDEQIATLTQERDRLLIKLRELGAIE